MIDTTDERIELITEEQSQGRGVSIAIFASLIVHSLLVVYLVRNYHPVQQNAADVPIARYVELIKQNPQDFVEAPGEKVASAPLTAPLSNANRKASAPEATGDKRTAMPGDGSGLYVPPQTSGEADNAPSSPARAPQQAQQQQAPQQQPAQQTAPSQPSQASSQPSLSYRPTEAAAAAPGLIDWRKAIPEVAKVASLGGSRHGGTDVTGSLGGEKGYADNGPVSFETQWYDWGEYADSMVSRIRVNWYNNMPELLKTGLGGVVTIRFTIHRDGRISDVTILSTSTIPPYDFAAKKAIELSSPLNPLPKDFPSETERVTCAFYYNKEIPSSQR